MATITAIDKTTVREESFRKEDFNVIADWVVTEWDRRKKARCDMEKQWAEVDRQLALVPKASFKQDRNGRPIEGMEWLSEIELPLQCQTLETLTADARRLKFPSTGLWFRGRAALSDRYMQRFENLPSPTGSDEEPPSQVQQDIGDRLAEGLLHHWHSQYDFESVYDQIDAEAFKYGTGVARVRKTTKRVLTDTRRGTVEDEQTFPVIIPQRLTQTYLDDRQQAIAAEGYMVGAVHIYERTQFLADLRMAAKAGNSDVEDEQSGGWMGKPLEGIEANKDGVVTTLEAEGDLLVPRAGGETIFLPNVIVNIAIGHSSHKRTQGVVYRFRFKEFPFSSYLLHPYHVTKPHEPYATSPLMMGWPMQEAASNALSRVMDSGILNVLPPLNYDPDDPQFAAHGPRVFPGALWPSRSGVKPEQIGDPSAISGVYQALVQHYFDVTGVNKPRLGQQTLSHTTAYAKSAELDRGTIRTVDFVRASLKGPMTRLLDMEYRMGLKMMRSDKRMTYFIEPWNEFVHIQKGHLPDTVFWQAIGSAGPNTNEQERQERLAALQMALQLDQMNVALGNKPSIDIKAAQRQILMQGGWQDISFLTDSMSGAAEVSGGQLPAVLSETPQGPQ